MQLFKTTFGQKQVLRTRYWDNILSLWFPDSLHFQLFLIDNMVYSISDITKTSIFLKFWRRIHVMKNSLLWLPHRPSLLRANFLKKSMPWAKIVTEGILSIFEGWRLRPPTLKLTLGGDQFQGLRLTRRPKNIRNENKCQHLFCQSHVIFEGFRPNVKYSRIQRISFIDQHGTFCFYILFEHPIWLQNHLSNSNFWKGFWWPFVHLINSIASRNVWKLLNLPYLQKVAQTFFKNLIYLVNTFDKSIIFGPKSTRRGHWAQRPFRPRASGPRGLSGRGPKGRA